MAGWRTQSRCAVEVVDPLWEFLARRSVHGRRSSAFWSASRTMSQRVASIIYFLLRAAAVGRPAPKGRKYNLLQVNHEDNDHVLCYI